MTLVTALELELVYLVMKRSNFLVNASSFAAKLVAAFTSGIPTTQGALAFGAYETHFLPCLQIIVLSHLGSCWSKNHPLLHQ